MGIASRVPKARPSPNVPHNPIRAAYADPPYIGKARKHYAADPQCAEVDHSTLIAQLCTFDAWALSCSSPTLRILLPMCPENTRIAAWVKPFAIFKKGVNPVYAWEPILYVPRRRGLEEPAIRDWISANCTLKRGLVGVKPEAFNRWLIDLLGIGPGDELTELFPGSGNLTRMWQGMQP